MSTIVIFHHVADSRRTAADALAQAGHEVHVANAPDAAWEAVQSCHPDLVITNFPAFLTDAAAAAPTLTEAIRLSREFDDLPVLNLRSYSEPIMAEYAARAGVTESAKMPEIPQSLIEIVQRLIKDREGAR